MSRRANITISKYVRQEVDELIESGVVTTLASAVHLGLLMLIRRHKLERWDDDVFAEYEAGMLHRNPRSGILFSRKFQKDLSLLVKKEPEIKRGVQVALKKSVKKKLELKNYYYIDFIFNKNKWRILLRKQGKDLIACRIGLAVEFFI
ncbi:MAG: hypothetical protein HN846_01775 [Candidatus Pacebacteria bacterium]|nr:hypothetical protein [Candidatus Paceibacterota bacterium]MBT3511886.1 hypothetical protein [Candidatus Paceibacterota bacterium]MBT4005382.1 hypothetical protein [Candidatus Paceibacterota bacterium]MBT4359302.1 hypothetical protein [Candidatus Paceibacterota bacterium]MBT4681307.1 hypothetical protein [Candidatus Paceibacterota bacterium]